MKNIVAPCARYIFAVKLTWCIAVLLITFLSPPFYSVYWNNYNPANNQLCNHLPACCNFWMLSYVLILLLTGWSKKFFFINHNIIIFHIYFLKITSCIVLLHTPLFQTIKQKFYLLLENLDQSRNLNIDFVLMLKHLIDIYSW